MNAWFWQTKNGWTLSSRRQRQIRNEKYIRWALRFPHNISQKSLLPLCVFAVLAVFASVIPYFWWGPWYLAGILAVDCVVVGATLRALRCGTPGCVKASGSTTLLKMGMFASLVVFTLSAVFLWRFPSCPEIQITISSMILWSQDCTDAGNEMQKAG